jgi:hypothetical protein
LDEKAASDPKRDLNDDEEIGAGEQPVVDGIAVNRSSGDCDLSSSNRGE